VGVIFAVLWDVAPCGLVMCTYRSTGPDVFEMRTYVSCFHNIYVNMFRSLNLSWN
jgi:hypothetical protein